jgi:hypothetical protein
MDFMLDLNFVLCCGSLKHSLPVPQFGVGSISKDTCLNSQPDVLEPKEDVAIKIQNLRTFERVEVKAV